MFIYHVFYLTVTYTLSLHDALPICRRVGRGAGLPVVERRVAPSGGRAWPVLVLHPAEGRQVGRVGARREQARPGVGRLPGRSEEHTSELQSRENIVCRLLLEQKKIF